MNKVILTLSRLLPQQDREVVLGDICESQLSTLEALFDVLGLISRRTLHAYGHWKAWVCLTITPVLSLLLIGISVKLAELAYRHVGQGAFSIQSSLEMLRLSCLLIVASMSAAFAAVHVLRKAAIVLLIAAIIPAVKCFAQCHIAGMPRAGVFLFLLPIVFGIWFGLRTTRHVKSLGIVSTLLLLCTLGPTSVNGVLVECQCLLLITPAFYCAIAGHSGAHHA